MKLHLGCGHKILEGFVNIDIREETGCDIIDDISLLTKVENNSAELIYCCHVLEHFSRNDFSKVLERWHEVLQPGGVLRLSVPDFEQVCRMYAGGMPLKNLMGFLYGGQNYPENFHFVTFDFDTLGEALEKCGFTNIRRWDWRTTEHAHVDDYSQSFLPHMDKTNGTLMSLNIECTKI